MAKSFGHRLDVERVRHKFGDAIALHEIDLAVQSGEIVALLGPSGCGKTTLLRIIAGFISQTEGRVLFDGEPVDHLQPNRRGVGIVFQNYALFPHMTVAENVAYGLEAHRWERVRIAARVKAMLDLVQMRAFAERLPRQLSGGQQQRIALARCLAIDPKILLLDEPFGALDKNLRLDMQIEVKRLQRSYGITTVLVTHDQEEALSMADRVAVMNRGRIEQIASPTDIYDRPATQFVNQFIGATNLFKGELAGSTASGTSIRLGNGAILEGAPATDVETGTPVWLSIRPEQLTIVPAAGANCLKGSVKTVLPLGAQVAYDIEIAGVGDCKVVLARSPETPLMNPGAAVCVAPSSQSACRVFPR